MRNILFLALFLTLVSCGGSKSPTGGTAAPTVTFSNPPHGAIVSGTVTLSAAVTNADSIRFQVGGAVIATTMFPSVSTSWNSASVTDGAHVLRAVAMGPGGSATAEISVTVQNGGGGVSIAVNVTPPTATAALNGTVQFAAGVTNTVNQNVTWSVIEGAGFGTVTQAGLYRAPATLPSPAVATVRAVSQADPTKSATAR